MTPLRQRMLEDMQMRNLSRGTQRVYVRAVAQLARYYQKSPDQLGREDIRSYLVGLVQKRRVAPSTYNQIRCALKFFYQVTLGQEWGSRPDRLPTEGEALARRPQPRRDCPILFGDPEDEAQIP